MTPILLDEARVADMFVVLVCEDTELLNEEFNSIVRAFRCDLPAGPFRIHCGDSPTAKARYASVANRLYGQTRRSPQRWVLPRAPPLAQNVPT